MMDPLGHRLTTRSRMGLGLAALGRPGYINLGHGDDTRTGRDVASMEARAFEVLDAAWAGGIRDFDAARSYGRAEEFLAHWLESRGIEPENVRVSSKWGYVYKADWRVEAEAHEIKDHSLANLSRQLLETRSLLGPYLRLYQIHSATMESGVLDDREVHQVLGELLEEGVAIGLSLSGPRQAETLRRALEVEVNGRRLFDSVQATWNLLEPSAGPVLAEAHSLGLRVILKEALANGRMTSRNASDDFADRRLLLDTLAQQRETTPDALALAAALAQPWADLVLSGASTAGQLASNLDANHVGWDSRLEQAFATFAEPAEQYWATRSALPWN